MDKFDKNFLNLLVYWYNDKIEYDKSYFKSLIENSIPRNKKWKTEKFKFIDYLFESSIDIKERDYLLGKIHIETLKKFFEVEEKWWDKVSTKR